MANREYGFNRERADYVLARIREDPNWMRPLTRRENFVLWLFDTGRLGQTLHYLWLTCRGSSRPRRAYLRAALLTLRYGPRY